MNNQESLTINVKNNSPLQNHSLSNEEMLLKYFLTLPDLERESKFAPPSTACKLVGRSPRTIQRWIEAGFIRAVYIVGRYQVEIASLKEFVQRESHEHIT
jgi:hypothetical protein